MNRQELARRWEAQCEYYIPPRPDGFSPDGYVLEAVEVAIPADLSRQMAEGDHMVKVDFHQSTADRGLGPLERSRDEMAVLTSFLRQDDLRMAFGYEFGQGEDIHVVRDPASLADRDVWFIGDLHGDLLALRSLLAFGASNSRKRPLFVFLGDFFDRHPCGLNVLIEVVRLLRDDPSSVFLLAGNHDDGLEWTEAGFMSRITPHQFCDEMNAFGDETTVAFVKQFIQFAQSLPIGLLLPNGLFASHAGVPSRPERSVKNVWEGLDAQGVRRVIREKRGEFLCNRFQKDCMTKLRPDFGWMEIAQFGAAMETAYGASVRFLLRGHDHCDLCRHDWARSTFEGNENCPPERALKIRDALTMVSMVMMYEEQRLPGFKQHETSYPSIARYRAEDPRPEVYTVCFETAVARSYIDAVAQAVERDHAQILVAKKAPLENERRQICEEQDEIAAKEKNARECAENMNAMVAKSRQSLNAWQQKVVLRA